MVERDKPLAGKRILVTRPREEVGRLADGLRALGADPWEFPLIEILPPQDWSPLDSALGRLGSFGWVIFTSANGVRFFFARRQELGLNSPLPVSLRWGAIGPATARALAENGIRVDFVPTRYIAEAIVEEIGEIRGQRILLPRAEGARPVLAEGLRAQEAEVEEVPAYRTLPKADISPLIHAIKEGRMDMITLTSPSAVRSLVERLGSEPAKALGEIAIVCIGPITAQAAQELGINVDLVAEEHTVEGLLKALVSFAAEHQEVRRHG